MMEKENALDFGLLLQQHRLEIVKSIDTEKQFIRCYLQSKLVLDDDDCERISSGITRQDRAAKLLDILSVRGPDAWRHFVDALEFESPRLYEKITGKKANAQSHQDPYTSKRSSKIWDLTTGINGKALIDFDREFLANQLDRAVVDLKNMTYWHCKIVEEKNLLERKLCQATDDLHTKEKCMEDMQEEMMHLISDRQAKETEESCKNTQTPMHDYLQELWKENMEKSRVMLALQGKVILANEQIDNLKKKIAQLSSKNDTLRENIRELTIINDYERKNSSRLKRTSSEQTEELKRELYKMKFQYSILSDEKESLQLELDSFQKWTEVLNSRFDALKQEKSALQGNSENLSNRFQKLHKYIGDLEEKQTWQNFKIERSEHEVNRVKSTLETLRADRDKLLHSLQTVRLARDEAEKENFQLRSNLKTMQVKYEKDIEEQRILSKEFLTKHESLLEELASMEEKVFKAEIGLKLARQDTELKVKDGKESTSEEVVGRTKDIGAPHKSLPETQLRNGGDPEEESDEETPYSFPKRKRDSLIDSIRRKLMSDDDECDSKHFSLPNRPTRPMLDEILDYEQILMMNPYSYGQSKSQSLPTVMRSKECKTKQEEHDNGPASKKWTDRFYKVSDKRDSTTAEPNEVIAEFVRVSRNIAPFRSRCFCIDSQTSRPRRRSQSLPFDLVMGDIQEKPEDTQ